MGSMGRTCTLARRGPHPHAPHDPATQCITPAQQAPAPPTLHCTRSASSCTPNPAHVQPGPGNSFTLDMHVRIPVNQLIWVRWVKGGPSPRRPVFSCRSRGSPFYEPCAGHEWHLLPERVLASTCLGRAHMLRARLHWNASDWRASASSPPGQCLASEGGLLLALPVHLCIVGATLIIATPPSQVR